MRFKYYLRGIALGILFSVVIMIIAIHFHKDEILSDSEIISRAEKLGMIMPDSKNESPVIETETEENDENKPLDELIPNSETTSTEIIQATEQISETSEQKPVRNFDNLDYVIIDIEPGDIPRTLANKLKEYNIIEDADDFRHYIGRKTKRALMVGQYQIPKDASYDDIIKIVFK